MTEIGVPLASDGFDLANATSCGKPRTGCPGYEVRIVDEHDEERRRPARSASWSCARDEPWVINPGYFGMPERTAEAWRNGWFHTGDGFQYDEDGNYYFVDRMKDAIRRRGENISSFEVEAFVNQHPDVAESRRGRRCPSELGEDEIKVSSSCRDRRRARPRASSSSSSSRRMPQFMLPRYVEVVDRRSRRPTPPSAPARSSCAPPASTTPPGTARRATVP